MSWDVNKAHLFGKAVCYNDVFPLSHPRVAQSCSRLDPYTSHTIHSTRHHGLGRKLV